MPQRTLRHILLGLWIPVSAISGDVTALWVAPDLATRRDLQIKAAVGSILFVVYPAVIGYLAGFDTWNLLPVGCIGFVAVTASTVGAGYGALDVCECDTGLVMAAPFYFAAALVATTIAVAAGAGIKRLRNSRRPGPPAFSPPT